MLLGVRIFKFRRNVKDVIQPHHDDRFLLRWLKARSWNVEAAEKMLRTSLEWREQWEIDSISTWNPPEVLTKYYVSGMTGYDKSKVPEWAKFDPFKDKHLFLEELDENLPRCLQLDVYEQINDENRIFETQIYIVPIGPLDIVGLLHSVTRQDMIKMTAKLLENTLELAQKAESYEIVAIFDLENFILKPWAWRPAMELVISFLRMYEGNYPEILKVCYVINAPKIFALAFSVIKKFINEYTISKIKIYKGDRKKWQAVLLQHIDPENLPKHYGGTMVDADGDPKCPSKVWQGGKVPKSYYKSKLAEEQDSKQCSTVINQGKIFTLDFLVTEEECYLKWDFRTDGHDIKFGVSYIDENGETHQAVRSHRIASNKLDVVGAVSCKAPATYTVTFDNSYSMLRSKKLYYSIYVTQPLSKLKISTLPDMKVSEDVPARNAVEN